MMMIKDNHYVAIVADVAVAPEGLSRRGAARQLQYNGTNAEKAHLDQSYYLWPSHLNWDCPFRL